MKSKRYAMVNQKRCVACGACVKECPRGAIEVQHGCWAMVDSSCCIGCGKCSAICPANCITLSERENRDEA